MKKKNQLLTRYFAVILTTALIISSVSWPVFAAEGVESAGAIDIAETEVINDNDGEADTAGLTEETDTADSDDSFGTDEAQGASDNEILESDELASETSSTEDTSDSAEEESSDETGQTAENAEKIDDAVGISTEDEVEFSNEVLHDEEFIDNDQIETINKERMGEAIEDFTIDNGVLTKYNGSNEVVEIPDTVITIGESAFADNKSIKIVTIPSSTTTISSKAFENCSNLRTVNGGDNVTNINSNAFTGCTDMYFDTTSDAIRTFANKNGFVYYISGSDLDFEWGGHRYRIINESVSPSEAASRCKELGGYLATISFEEERKAIVDALKTQSDLYNSYLISGIHETNSNWYWDTDEPVQYVKWQMYSERDGGNNVAHYAAGYTCGYYLKGGVGAYYYSIPMIGGYTGNAEDRVYSHYMALQIKDYNKTWFGTFNPPYHKWQEGSMFQFNDPSKEDNMGYICEWGDNFEKIAATYDPETKTVMLVGVGDMQNYTKESCKNAAWRKWLDETDYITCSSSVTSIGDYAFYQADKIKDFDSGRITSIGEYAFAECSELNNVELDGVKEIGKAAFDNDDTLSYVEFPSSLTSATTVFGTERNNEITVLFKGTTIPDNMFNGCKQLKHLDLTNVKTVGHASFKDCTDLLDVNFRSCETISSSAFEGCRSLITLSVPYSVKKINSLAFAKCGIYKVTMEGSAPTLESGNEFTGNDDNLTFIVRSYSISGYQKDYWTNYNVVSDDKYNTSSYYPSEDGWQVNNHVASDKIGTVGEDLFYRLYDRNDKKNQTLYQGNTAFPHLRNIGDGGACAGMSISNVLCYEEMPVITDWNSGLTMAHQITADKLSLNSQTLNVSLKDWIAISHIWQASVEVVDQRNKNKNKLKTLIKRIKEGTPTVVFIDEYTEGDNGNYANHAMVAYKVKEFEGNTEIYVYDPNNGTNDYNRLVIKSPVSNKQSDWSYYVDGNVFKSNKSDISFLTDLAPLYNAIKDGEKVSAKKYKLVTTNTDINTDAKALKIDPASASGSDTGSTEKMYYIENGTNVTITGNGEDNVTCSLTTYDNEISLSASPNATVALGGDDNLPQVTVTDDGNIDQTELTIVDKDNNETTISGDAESEVSVTKDEQTGVLQIRGYKSFEITAETDDDILTERISGDTADTVYEVTVVDNSLNVKKQSEQLTQDDVKIKNESYTYTGSAIEPGVEVTVADKTLINDTDYTVFYQDNIQPGTATVTIQGKGSYIGTVTKTFLILPGKTTRGDMFNLANNVKVTWKEVPGAKYYKVYRYGVTDTKESRRIPVIVTTGLVGWDKEPGLTNGHAYRYTVVASLTGKGDSSGDSKLFYTKFMYRLKTVVIRSVKNTAPGKVTVKYDKTVSGDSYVLQYCERKDMVGAKTKVVLGANNTSYVIGGLKKGKTYYISIRVRKKVNGIDYYTTFGVPKQVTVTK